MPSVIIQRAIISPTSAAIKTGGQQGEPLKVLIEAYPQPGLHDALIGLRGHELVVVMATASTPAEQLHEELHQARHGARS